MEPKLCCVPNRDGNRRERCWWWCQKCCPVCVDVKVFTWYIIILFVEGVLYSFGIFSPYLEKDYGHSSTTVSIASAFLFGMQKIAGSLSKEVIKDVGWAGLMVWGGLLAFLGFIGAPWPEHFVWYIVMYGIVGGAGLGILQRAALVGLKEFFPEDSTTATEISNCALGFGAILFTPIALLVLLVVSWKTSVRGLGVISLIMGIAGCACDLPPVEKPGVSLEGLLSAPKSEESSQQKQTKTRITCMKCGNLGFCWCSWMFHLFWDPLFCLLAIATAFTFLGMQFPFLHIVDTAVRHGLDSLDAISLLVVVGVVHEFIKVSNVVPQIAAWMNDFWKISFALALMALATLGLTFCDRTFSAYFAIAAFLGFSSAAYTTLSASVVLGILGISEMDAGIRMLSFIAGLASLIGAVLSACARQLASASRRALDFGVLLFVIACVLSSIIAAVKSYLEYQKPKSNTETPTDNGTRSKTEEQEVDTVAENVSDADPPGREELCEIDPPKANESEMGLFPENTDTDVANPSKTKQSDMAVFPDNVDIDAAEIPEKSIAIHFPEVAETDMADPQEELEPDKIEDSTAVEVTGLADVQLPQEETYTPRFGERIINEISTPLPRPKNIGIPLQPKVGSQENPYGQEELGVPSQTLVSPKPEENAPPEEKESQDGNWQVYPEPVLFSTHCIPTPSVGIVNGYPSQLDDLEKCVTPPITSSSETVTLGNWFHPGHVNQRAINPPLPLHDVEMIPLEECENSSVKATQTQLPITSWMAPRPRCTRKFQRKNEFATAFNFRDKDISGPRCGFRERPKHI